MKLWTDDELAQLLSHDIFHLISETADSLGLECYVVGGYVRDLFLERPSKDIDVVVVGSGIALAKALKKRLGHKAHLAVFRNFGTAQLTVAPTNLPPLGEANGNPNLGTEQIEEPPMTDGQATKASHMGGRLEGAPIEVEFVGARKESYDRTSRKPHVEDGTLEDDQNRRDFTINAMAICLNKDRYGELVDPFDGIYDLEDGIIRTPLDPDITFSDDPLRMMRCVRFATQLRFDIERETREALSRNAHRLDIVSRERIADELNKIMLSPRPSIGIYDLYEAQLLERLLPELTKLDIVETRNGRAHKNNFYHTLEVLDNVARQSDNLWLRWAALLHDIGKPKSKRWEPPQGWTFHNHNYIGAKMVPEIFRRLKLPQDSKMRYVQKLVDLHMRPIVIADQEVTDSAVRRLINDAGDDIDDLMTLCEADITSKNEVRKARFLDNFRIVREKLAALKEKDFKRLLQPVIDGNEIMQMFNLKPSAEVGLLKKAMKDAVLDNSVPNEREPLMALLQAKAKEMGL